MVTFIPVADQESVAALLKWVQANDGNALSFSARRIAPKSEPCEIYIELCNKRYPSLKEAAYSTMVLAFKDRPCPEFDLSDFQQAVNMVAEKVVYSFVVYNGSSKPIYEVIYQETGHNFWTRDLKELVYQMVVTVTHLS